MKIPVCPGCGGSSWASVEDYSGGSKRFELRADGWRLVDDSLELRQTDFSCIDCGYDPSDGEDGEELWDVLNRIDTAPAAEEESGSLADDPSSRPWPDHRAA
jgi:hypothetical protein